MAKKTKIRKKAIMFIDGNNWYHNIKGYVKKPKDVDFEKLKLKIEKKFDLDIFEIRYYNSIPDIELGEKVYYKHMIFLNELKKKGIKVSTAKLKKIRTQNQSFRVEKGIDVMIAIDMIQKALLEEECETCVLISGDSDFVPAARLIKGYGKEVLSVSSLKGYARELLQGEFRFWILKKPDILRLRKGE